MSEGGSTRAIVAALLANIGIAIAKFIGFLITGASSMLAESVHSVADSGNQALLLLGGRKAKREADTEHQFGYGANRFFYAFVVAIVLFLLGSAFAAYEGIHKLQHPEPLTSPIVAVVILLVAVGLEGFSFRTAVRESNRLRAKRSWWQFIRKSRNPELPIVLLEDFGALIGLVFALLGVTLTWATGEAVFDAIGTLAISALLGVIAVILIVETRSMLIGEAALPEEQAAIRRLLTQDPHGVLDGIIHLRTLYIAPEDVLVAAKLSVRAGSTIEQIAAAINHVETQLRAQVPTVALIYLEPDLLRAGAPPAQEVPPVRPVEPDAVEQKTNHDVGSDTDAQD